MAIRVGLIVSALLVSIAITGCTEGFVGSDCGVRDAADAADIAVIVGALGADPRVESARYITPEEMAAAGEVDTTERQGDAVIENHVPNGYISVDLKSGYGMRDLEDVWDSVRRLPECERVLLPCP